MMRAAALVATPVARRRTARYGRRAGWPSITYSVLAMKAYCTLIRPERSSPGDGVGAFTQATDLVIGQV